MHRTPPSRNPFADPNLPTFADVIACIKADDKLRPRTKQNWVWGARAIARAVAKEPSAIPAHPEFLRRLLKRAAPQSVGLSPVTWNNARCFCGAALQRYGLVRMPAHYHAPLTQPWVALRTKIINLGIDRGLTRFLHYASAQGILPNQVDQRILEDFYKALVTESIVRDPYDVYIRTVRSWNYAAKNILEWPQQRLTAPCRLRTFAFPWTAFPPSLVVEVEAYLRRAAGPDLIDDHFTRAQSPATIEHRRAQLRRFATAIVRSGVPAATLTSLHAILVPEIAAAGLQYLVTRNNGKSSGSIAGLAYFLPALARRLDVAAEDLAKLRKIARKLHVPQHGLTASHRVALRAFDDPAAVEALLMLPRRILAEVKTSRRRGYREAKKIQTALAIELLLNAPVRIKNLASIDPSRHLVEIGGELNRGLHLVFPASEVKNENDLEFPLMEEAVHLLRVYSREWLPILSLSQSRFLFPGRSPEHHKAKNFLSRQIKRLVYEYTRLEMPAHRFRHALGKIFLDRHPGQYEVVRLLLGHKDIQTTIRFYTGTESATAARYWARTILGIRDGSRETEADHA